MKLHHVASLLVGLVALGSFISGCSRSETPASDNIPISEDRSMEIQSETRMSSPETALQKIPPIDAAAPKAYETATFGLG